MFTGFNTLQLATALEVFGRPVHAQGASDVFGVWRVTSAVVAPWQKADGAKLNRATYLTNVVQLRPPLFTGLGHLSATRATVAVRFADGDVARTLQYQLRSGDVGWRVDDVKYHRGRTFTRQLPISVQSENATNASVPAWADSAWRKASLARSLVRDSSVQPVRLVADFDGDGRRDVAWLVRHRTTRARGVLIVHASGRAAQQCGAGVTFGNGGDNFDWMDSWKVAPAQGGKGFALLVTSAESGGGRIEFRSGRYVWKQMGD